MRVQALTWEVVTTGEGIMTGPPVVDTGTGGIDSPRGAQPNPPADHGHAEANDDEEAGSLWLNQVPQTSQIPFNRQELRNYNDLIHWLIRRAIASGIDPLKETMSLLPPTFWDAETKKTHAYRAYHIHTDLINQETYKCKYADKDNGTEVVHFGSCNYLIGEGGNRKTGLQKFRMCKVCIRKMWLKEGFRPESGDTAASRE